jgi:hypothetical protein
MRADSCRGRPENARHPNNARVYRCLQSTFIESSIFACPLLQDWLVAALVYTTQAYSFLYVL